MNKIEINFALESINFKYILLVSAKPYGFLGQSRKYRGTIIFRQNTEDRRVSSGDKGVCVSSWVRFLHEDCKKCQRQDPAITAYYTTIFIVFPLHFFLVSLSLFPVISDFQRESFFLSCFVSLLMPRTMRRVSTFVTAISFSFSFPFTLRFSFSLRWSPARLSFSISVSFTLSVAIVIIPTQVTSANYLTLPVYTIMIFFFYR